VFSLAFWRGVVEFIVEFICEASGRIIEERFSMRRGCVSENKREGEFF